MVLLTEAYLISILPWNGFKNTSDISAVMPRGLQ